jgi:hypothetical protein
MAARASTSVHPKIFLSFASSHQDLARDVSTNLRRAGIAVSRIDEFTSGGRYSDELREAVRQAAAVVVVLSDVARGKGIPASILFEIGAAVGANKQIFVLVQNMTERLPFNVPQMQILPLNRADEIARHLLTSSAA